MLPSRRDHPHPARAGDPDVAALVALHPVGDAVLDHAAADVVEEQAAVRERPVGLHVVDPDQRSGRVVYVHERLVGREAQAVWLLELVVANDQLRLAATRREPVHALERQILLALQPEARHAPVGGVTEVDRAVGSRDHVVGTVQLLALVVAGDRLSGAVGALANQR